jgi:hypothetical protein
MSEDQLILSLLERLELQSERTIDRLTAIETRQEGMRVELVGVNRRLDLGNQRMDEANHRTSKNEDRIEAIERRHLVDDGIADGKAKQRAAYRRRVSRAWGIVWSPMGKGAGALGLLLAGWTLREIWPW